MYDFLEGPILFIFPSSSDFCKYDPVPECMLSSLNQKKKARTAVGFPSINLCFPKVSLFVKAIASMVIDSCQYFSQRESTISFLSKSVSSGFWHILRAIAEDGDLSPRSLSLGESPSKRGMVSFFGGCLGKTDREVPVKKLQISSQKIFLVNAINDHSFQGHAKARDWSQLNLNRQNYGGCRGLKTEGSVRPAQAPSDHLPRGELCWQTGRSSCCQV